MKAILKVQAEGYKHYPICNEVPVYFREYVIAGSEPTSGEGEYGRFLVQQISCGGFGFAYCIFHAKKEVSFIVIADKPFLVCNISLNGRAEISVQNTTCLVNEKNQFSLNYNTIFQEKVTLKADSYYSSIYLSYPVSFALYALKFFPVLYDFLNCMQHSETVFKNGKELQINLQGINLVNKLIHTPFSKYTESFQIDIIKQIFFILLKRASDPKIHSNSFYIDELEKIHTAKEFIDKNIPHHFSIPFVARKIGINEQKLKKGFKELFGIGLYTYLHEEIMKIAKNEIEQTNNTVKQVAIRSGYKNANNFSAAFKKRYNLSPLDWRRKFRNN